MRVSHTSMLICVSQNNVHDKLMVIECLHHCKCFTHLHRNLLEFVLLLTYFTDKEVKHRGEQTRDMYILKELLVELEN